DGVPNQRAAERALKKSTNLMKILQCINEFRKKDPATPVVLFSYLNPVYSFGYESFARRCRKSGVDGCLFVDMPYDEELFLQRKLRGKGVHTIFLVAPTTEKKRLSDIAGKTKGFLYAVSSLGVTGLRKNFEKGFSSYIRNIRKYCHHPLCVGFGISSPDMAKKASRYADGVIVGSAVVSRIEKNLSRKKDMKNDIMRFVRSIRKALS
ncbi:MAG: tryptophan synthase subunit alpha, partial [Candidatus Aureabacteria bacterium]|nr:tryptophan synthase subunit alpha [Candidatus Auribacterota bacterium]